MTAQETSGMLVLLCRIGVINALYETSLYYTLKEINVKYHVPTSELFHNFVCTGFIHTAIFIKTCLNTQSRTQLYTLKWSQQLYIHNYMSTSMRV